MTESRPKGTYTLLVNLDRDADIEVGALGVRAFSGGHYAYTGSAFGTGGFSRIERHRQVAAGTHDVRHWHIDYLLGHPAARIVAVSTSTGVDIECAVARSLPGRPVSGFGASDCDCDSHLTHATEQGDLEAAIARAHEETR